MYRFEAGFNVRARCLDHGRGLAAGITALARQLGGDLVTAGSTRREIRISIVMSVLTVTAGAVDAVTFLGLGPAFIAKVRGGGYRWFVVTLAVEVLLLFTAGALASVHTLNVHIVIAVIAGAMGWRSRAVVEANIPDMPTTVLQITLVKTIADVLTLRATTPHAPVLTRTRRLATVLGMFTGAVIGALLLRLGLAAALLCIAGFEACLVGLYSRAPLLWPTPQPAG
jgi:uncharacterized membrane protein YoaK (UPF0700 family)